MAGQSVVEEIPLNRRTSTWRRILAGTRKVAERLKPRGLQYTRSRKQVRCQQCECFLEVDGYVSNEEVWMNDPPFDDDSVILMVLR